MESVPYTLHKNSGSYFTCSIKAKVYLKPPKSEMVMLKRGNYNKQPQRMLSSM